MATVDWPPDYVAVFAKRQARIKKVRANPSGAREYYRTRPVEFIEHFCMTYDPRNAGTDVPAKLPFILFKRQRELIEFVLACLNGDASGLIEKCRDLGATWVCCALSVWLWLFWPGIAIGWGSRKEQLVDKLGDPDSIFEKMRMLIWGLPKTFLPAGFSPKEHMTYMKIINPENGATITGEAGDNIGRGGRKRIFFKDEAAHYERPELIEAALADNTRVQIDISSVNGLGNVFHRRREAGVEWTPGATVEKTCANVFVMDWRDHPAKTQEWYDMRKAKAEADGLLHIHAQEIDRDYAASVTGTVIPLEWIRAAIDAHIELDWFDGEEPEGMWGGSLDVADNDGSGDRNAAATRKGPVLMDADEWGAVDTGVTARKAVEIFSERAPLSVQYDAIGVGSGVKAEINRLGDEKLLPKGLKFVAWDAGAGPQNPDDHVIADDDETPLNGDFYANMKAQGWWELRGRFYRTWQWRNGKATYTPDECISISSKIKKLRQLEKELAQPTAGKGARLKLVINKTPEGTRSPNMGDAVMMAFWPMEEWEPPVAVFGSYGYGEG